MATYSIADAKNEFTQVVRLAESGSPVVVTRRGEPAVVIVSAEAYALLSARQSLNVWDGVVKWRAKHLIDAVGLTDVEHAKYFDHARERSPGRAAHLFEDED